MTIAAPPRNANVVLSLLSFGAGAADAFAFTALGGIFTANMTGNAVLATMFSRTSYLWTLVGAVAAIAAFSLALFVGFAITRGPLRAGQHRRTWLTALSVSAGCHKALILMWWFAPRSRLAELTMIGMSAAAMAFQTVAAKRDGILRGTTTTYVTGTMADLIQDLVDGKTRWSSPRWLPLAALPFGAACAVSMGNFSPDLTPLLPFAATLLALILVALCGSGCGR